MNFVRIEKPRRVSQISECLSAGTGCGWCRPILRKLFDQVNAARAAGEDGTVEISGFDDWSSEQYAEQRKQHIANKKSLPAAEDCEDEKAG